LSDFENGLINIEEALKIDSKNEKFLLRKANCLIYLNKEEEILEIIEKI
jgi:hypothetical protein